MWVLNACSSVCLVRKDTDLVASYQCAYRCQCLCSPLIIINFTRTVPLLSERCFAVITLKFASAALDSKEIGPLASPLVISHLCTSSATESLSKHPSTMSDNLPVASTFSQPSGHRYSLRPRSTPAGSVTVAPLPSVPPVSMPVTPLPSPHPTSQQNPLTPTRTSTPHSQFSPASVGSFSDSSPERPLSQIYAPSPSHFHSKSFCIFHAVHSN